MSGICFVKSLLVAGCGATPMITASLQKVFLLSTGMKPIRKVSVFSEIGSGMSMSNSFVYAPPGGIATFMGKFTVQSQPIPKTIFVLLVFHSSSQLELHTRTVCLVVIGFSTRSATLKDSLTRTSVLDGMMTTRSEFVSAAFAEKAA